MANPFTLSFGKEPSQYISRTVQTAAIADAFNAQDPVTQIYMISGVRGSGKTVLLTEVTKRFESLEEWIVVDLNPNRDMLQSLAAKLYGIPVLYKEFVKLKFNFSYFGLGVSVESESPITDIEQALDVMLKTIGKMGKKVLVTVDEAVNNEHVRVFASSFQIYLRRNYPLFVLMTGLYNNISDIQNEKTLTFLYRAPKIVMSPLNITAIASRYNAIFGISMKQSMSMAKLTMGYPFAFQVLGYLCWENKAQDNIEAILPEYDRYLEEFVYEKIWAELSQRDKEVVSAIAENGIYEVKEIRKKLDMTSGEMSVYRNRLEKKGLIDTSEYGKITLALPRFAEIVRNWNM